jgi:hypothetical protein
MLLLPSPFGKRWSAGQVFLGKVWRKNAASTWLEHGCGAITQYRMAREGTKQRQRLFNRRIGFPELPHHCTNWGNPRRRHHKAVAGRISAASRARTEGLPSRFSHTIASSVRAPAPAAASNVVRSVSIIVFDFAPPPSRLIPIRTISAGSAEAENQPAGMAPAVSRAGLVLSRGPDFD